MRKVPTDRQEAEADMEAWSLELVLLSVFGFFKEFRPATPFLTQYFIQPKWVNITEEQVTSPF